MQNDFMNDYNILLNELEQQLNELQASNQQQTEQIERLLVVNQQLNEQLEKLNNENRNLLNINGKQNLLLSKISEKLHLK